MNSGATFSLCGKYRYHLWRVWGTGRRLVFCMLNPSTAGADVNDQTTLKLNGFTSNFGFDGYHVINPYAYCATDPKDLKRAGYLVGPDNDATIDMVGRMAAEGDWPVVCGWGANARGMSRPAEVMRILRAAGAKTFALAFTADGLPRHPLMLPYSSTLQPFNPRTT